MVELPIIDRTYDLYKDVILLNNGLNKRMRYSLGVELEKDILCCFKNLVIAKGAPKPMKASYLMEVSSLLEVIVHK